MKLKNRFKNRFISHQNWVQWFTARDFRASIWAASANKNFRQNIRIMVRLSIRRNKSEAFQRKYRKPRTGNEEMQGFLDLMVKAGAPIYNINKTELYRKKFKEYDFQK